MPLASFDPLIREWFAGVGEPTEPQRLGWPEILSGRDVLISAPTGSGKTLAAFLSCLDNLVRLARTDRLPRRDHRALRLAAQGAFERHPEEPRSPSGANPRVGRPQSVFP